MRTATWEITPLIALRNCSTEAGGGQYRCDFGKGGVRVIKRTFFLRKFFLVSWRSAASVTHDLILAEVGGQFMFNIHTF